MANDDNKELEERLLKGIQELWPEHLLIEISSFRKVAIGKVFGQFIFLRKKSLLEIVKGMSPLIIELGVFFGSYSVIFMLRYDVNSKEIASYLLASLKLMEDISEPRDCDLLDFAIRHACGDIDPKVLSSREYAISRIRSDWMHGGSAY